MISFFMWLVRLLAWPWASRPSIERWPTAPEISVEMTQPPEGNGRPGYWDL